MKHKSAFSLIELSVVILIISLIIAMVIKSSRSVNSSRVATAISMTKNSPVSNIDGLSLWLESSNEENFNYKEATNGGYITLWKDINPQVVNKNDLTRATSDNKITYASSAINGLPAVYFSGNTSNDAANFLSGNAVPFTPSRTFTFFAVYQSTDTSNTSRTLSSNGIAGSAYDAWAYQKSTTSRCITFVGDVDATVGTLTNSPEILSMVYSGNGVMNAYINGAQTTITGTFSNNMHNFSTGNFILGSYNTEGVQQWKGYVAEIIIFNNNISNDDRKEVEKYLGKKYGIQVSVS